MFDYAKNEFLNVLIKEKNAAIIRSGNEPLPTKSAISIS